MVSKSELEKLEQRYRENPSQWFAALADTYRKAGELELALEVVRSGIVDRPDYSSAQIVLGRVLLDLDKEVEAAQAFQRVLELDPENVIALKTLGDISERQGDVAAARWWFRRLLDVDPMNEEAKNALNRMETLGIDEEDAASETVDSNGPQREAFIVPDELPYIDLSEAAAAEGTPADEAALDETGAPSSELAGAPPSDRGSADVEADVEAATVPGEPHDEAGGGDEPVEFAEEGVEAASDEQQGGEAVEDELVEAEFGDERGEFAEDVVEAAPDEDQGGEAVGDEPVEAELGDELVEPSRVVEPVEPGPADDFVDLEREDDGPELVASVGEEEPLVSDVQAAEAGGGVDGLVIEHDGEADEFVIEPESGPVVPLIELPQEPVSGEFLVEHEFDTGAMLPELGQRDPGDIRNELDMVADAPAAADPDAAELAEPVAEAREPDWPAEPAAAADELSWARYASAESVDGTAHAEDATIDAEEPAAPAEIEAAAGELPRDESTEPDLETVAEEPQWSPGEMDELAEAEGREPTLRSAEEALAPDGEVAAALPGMAAPETGPEEPTLGEEIRLSPAERVEMEPEPVVTGTMAEVYAQQGLHQEARAIYEKLLQLHPDDSEFRRRLDQLIIASDETVSKADPSSRFAAAQTGGISARAALQQIFSGRVGGAEQNGAEAIVEPAASPLAGGVGSERRGDEDDPQRQWRGV